MAQDINPREAIKQLEQHFGSHENMLIHNLTMLSSSGQPADIIFYRRKPLINVQISTKIAAARLYGLESQLPWILKRIEFSNGAVASLAEIWTVNPMPIDGFTDEELTAVDLTEGDERCGPNGETLRKMIRKMYQCKSHRETDLYLRRWIAS
jgi:hypothetical protein